MRAEHKFAREQRVEIDDPECPFDLPPTVHIVALLNERCEKHGALRYGCVHNDAAFAFCEEVLRPMSPTNRSKMN